MLHTAYNLEDLGECIAAARKERGCRQDEFAKVLGISHATLSRLETGSNTSTDTMMRALQYLGLRIVVIPKGVPIALDEEDGE